MSGCGAAPEATSSQPEDAPEPPPRSTLSYGGRTVVGTLGPYCWDDVRSPATNDDAEEGCGGSSSAGADAASGFPPFAGEAPKVPEGAQLKFLYGGSGTGRAEREGGVDHWEEVLSGRRYLCGDRLTEADVCMFVTLVRFDPAYHYHFKCNLWRLRDYPNLWGYTRDVYQQPGVAETVNLEHIKRHYATHPNLNLARIIPKGPVIDFNESHDREHIAGSASASG